MSANNGGPVLQDEEEIFDDALNAETRAAVRGEIERAFAREIPVLVTTFREEMQALIAQAVAGGGGGRPPSYREFAACQPPSFDGTGGAIHSMRWIADMESAFRASSCPDGSKVTFAAYNLRGAAKDWWDSERQADPLVRDEVLTWAEFVPRFERQFVSQADIDRLTREYLSMEQHKDETVAAFYIRFGERARFAGDYARNARMQINRFVGALRPEISELVSSQSSTFTTLQQAVESAKNRELYLETTAAKRDKAPSQQLTAFKKQRTNNYQNNPKGGAKGGSTSGGGSQLICYRCNKPGHTSARCNQQPVMCFHCNKMGHKRPDCPLFKSGAPAVTMTPPAPTRFTPQKKDAPKVNSRVFHMTAAQAQEAPDVVTGTI